MKKLVPHFRRSELYSEWGRSPVGEVGDFHSPVRGRQPVLYSPSAMKALSERIYCRMDIGVCDGVAERMGVEVRRGVSAAELTTFRGGGEAARVYVPRSAEQAAEFAAECARLGAEFFVLGGGSKTLIADGEVLRPVLSTAKMRAVTFAGEDEGRVFLRAESGARVHDLMRACAVYGRAKRQTFA